MGGKTGIDTAYGKNLVRVFKQPKAVFIDVEFSNTLPQRIHRDPRMAEVIKHSLILEDKSYFNFLIEYKDEILALNSDFLIKDDEKNLV